MAEACDRYGFVTATVTVPLLQLITSGTRDRLDALVTSLLAEPGAPQLCDIEYTVFGGDAMVVHLHVDATVPELDTKYRR